MSRKRQRKSCSLSAEITGHNEDIMTEISLYLPIKSILRFRSVSKRWHSLLTNPRFIRRHASRKPTNSSLFIQSSGYIIESLNRKGGSNSSHNLDVFDFGYLKKSCPQDILNLKASCNGLLLFESNNFMSKGGRQMRRRHRFYVCNPSTRKYTRLAVPDTILTADPSNLDLYLAFDPSKSPHYKVVFFWKHDSSRDYHIAIYSSKTRTSRKLGCKLNTSNMSLTPGVFLNDAIHWACSPLRTTSSIIYFDINQGSINLYPNPPCSGSENHVKYFGGNKDRLQLILGDEEMELFQRVFDVYELQVDHSSWFVKYKVDLDAIAVKFPEIVITDDNLGMMKEYFLTFFLRVLEEDEQDPTLVLAFADQLLAYNLIDKTARKLCNIRYRGVDIDDGSICYGDKEFRAICWYQTFHSIENLFDV